MNTSWHPPEVPYPAQPWTMYGPVWITLLTAQTPLTLPTGLKPLLSAKKLAVLVAQYRAGTLVYNEFVICSTAHRGRRVGGLSIQYIWVDEPAALWGGRRNWGIPKRIAHFDWHGQQVTITDEDGELAAITLQPPTRTTPKVFVPLSGFGLLNNALMYIPAHVTARIGVGRLRVDRWAEHLPALVPQDSYPALRLNPCRMTVGRGRLLGHFPPAPTGHPHEDAEHHPTKASTP